MSGPLTGLRIIEMAGIGPGPYGCMLLSDLGAEVTRIDRPAGGTMSAKGHPGDVLNRGRQSIAIDLKHPEGVATARQLISAADVVVEGMRPGVMEKLGLGPEVCCGDHPGLIYARMTGWGQHGPLSQAAGHDINYIAITGALAGIGRKDTGPVPPLNLVGDFGGGSMFLVMGILAALYERNQSGRGQVIDAAITDGAISLMACMQGFTAMGMWEDGNRGSNMLDTGAHYYDTYECADGQWISIGSIEPQFYALLMEKLGLEAGDGGFMEQFDKSQWPALKTQIRDIIKTRTRAHWNEVMEGTDVCYGPVLTTAEAAAYPHNVERGSFVEVDGHVQAAPAPRFSRTPGEIQGLPVGPGANSTEILARLGMGGDEIDQLIKMGAVS